MSTFSIFVLQVDISSHITLSAPRRALPITLAESRNPCNIPPLRGRRPHREYRDIGQAKEGEVISCTVVHTSE